jgi:hypothetical protein
MRQLRQLWLGTIVAAGIVGLTATTPRATAGGLVIHIDAGEPVPNAPVYHYMYYPDQEVYFVPETSTYWWLKDGAWISGPRVPEGISLGARVNLDVDAREPWHHHEVIVKRFPHHDRDRH